MDRFRRNQGTQEPVWLYRFFRRRELQLPRKSRLMSWALAPEASGVIPSAARDLLFAAGEETTDLAHLTVSRFQQSGCHPDRTPRVGARSARRDRGLTITPPRHDEANASEDDGISRTSAQMR